MLISDPIEKICFKNERFEDLCPNGYLLFRVYCLGESNDGFYGIRKGCVERQQCT